LNEILVNATPIERIIFRDYADPVQWNPPRGLSRVASFWIWSCSARFVSAFLEACQGYETDIKDFALSLVNIAPEDFTDILTGLVQLPSAANLRILSIMAKGTVLPIHPLLISISFFDGLEYLTIQEFSGDCAPFLSALCAASLPIKVLKLLFCDFGSPVESSATLPAWLVMFDVTGGRFGAPALSSLFRLITRKGGLRAPFIFVGERLKLERDALSFIPTMDFDSLESTMSEFDWSGNPIPKAVARHFFAYLFTQSELRFLVLRRCQTDLNHGEFLGFVRQFVFGLPLMALDLSGAFDRSTFAEFVRSLAGAVWMRRLSLANSAGGGEVAAALADILPGLAELSEVAADCLRPTLPVFYRLWEAIAKHPSIRASDFPVKDLKGLGLSVAKMGPEQRAMFEELAKRPTPSRAAQRAEFLIAQLVTETETEIFATAALLTPATMTSTISEADSGTSVTLSSEDETPISDEDTMRRSRLPGPSLGMRSPFPTLGTGTVFSKVNLPPLEGL
jgi:hypothetical protein